LILFTASSALCGLAWNLPSLVFFRTLQGLGGGMLQPLGMAIVFTMITPLERPYFMAMLGLPVVLAPILGPTVGGALVEYASWRMIFLVNVPIGVLNVFLALSLLKETPIRHDARLDKLGMLLAAIAFPCILLGLSEGGSLGWTSPVVELCLAGGAVALPAFVLTELRKREPLLHVRLFADNMFALAMGINFVTQFSLFGISYLLPVFLQSAHGLSPAQTGLVLLPGGVATFVAMNVGGRRYNRFGPRRLACIGLAVLFVATLFLSRIDAGTSPWLIAGLASLRGFAQGFCIMPVQTTAFNTVPQEHMPRATALTNVLFRVYGSATAAILTGILVASLAFHGAPAGASITGGTAPIGFMVDAFSDAFLVMTAITAVGFVGALFLHDRLLDQLRSSPGGLDPSGKHRLHVSHAEAGGD
jgi:EmrB/QacA subfamily drug resistance transporter